MDSPSDSNDDNSEPKVGEKGKDGKYSPFDVSQARWESRERGRRVSPSELRTNSEGKYYVKGDPVTDSDSEFEYRPTRESSTDSTYRVPWDLSKDNSPKPESKDVPTAPSKSSEPSSDKRPRSEDENEDSNLVNKKLKSDHPNSSDESRDIVMTDLKGPKSCLDDNEIRSLLWIDDEEIMEALGLFLVIPILILFILYVLYKFIFFKVFNKLSNFK